MSHFAEKDSGTTVRPVRMDPRDRFVKDVRLALRDGVAAEELLRLLGEEVARQLHDEVSEP